MKQHMVVLTGAGMSAESGLKTFRDENGLWEGHDVTKVATPKAFKENPQLVLEFYNQRRKQLKQVKPNAAHFDLAKLESQYDVTIITQNIDNLHERAGSTNVIHLHGELFKVRSTYKENDIRNWESDLHLGDFCQNGYQLRPHIVWFGEPVPMMEKAIDICLTADILVIIGTSMQVYPAASLIHYIPSNTPIYFINPKPNVNEQPNLKIISEPATVGVAKLIQLLK